MSELTGNRTKIALESASDFKSRPNRRLLKTRPDLLSLPSCKSKEDHQKGKILVSAEPPGLGTERENPYKGNQGLSSQGMKSKEI